VSTKTGPFAKEGSSQRWTEEIFKIASVNSTNPPTYNLESLTDEEIKGIFYEPEMQLAQKPTEFLVEKIIGKRIFKKKTQYLVRWLGYSSKDDTWEPSDNLPKELIEEYNKSLEEPAKASASKSKSSYNLRSQPKK
jgi:hypothetical protein